jgi:hypothetical protein
MKYRGVLAVIASAFLLMLGPAARADGVEVTVSTISGTAGSTVEAIGTITNDTDETVDLNGDSFSVTVPTLALDDTDFFINAPLSLDPGMSSGPFDIFAIQISPTAAPGTVGPNIFQVLGGPDGNTFDVLGTATFNVDVEGAPTVPEPSGALLLLCGIAALALMRRRGTRFGFPAAAGFPQHGNSQES